MPEDTRVYVFRDRQGIWVASTDEEQAQDFIEDTFYDQLAEEMTLLQLFQREPHAMVMSRHQYYWAKDLLESRPRGAIN